MRKLFFVLLLPALLVTVPARAADYVIDTDNNHAFIQFRIQHLGFSWLYGRFDRFSGTFSYDPQHPEQSRVAVDIDASSIDTNNALRDKHLRSAEFFDVDHIPTARFVSTAYTPLGNGKARLEGRLTLHGVTHPIRIDVQEMGHGKDPWGGYRRGFHGTVALALADYGFTYNLGPAAREVYLDLSLEGIRK